MERPEWNCKDCDNFFFWGYERLPTQKEIKTEGFKKQEIVIGIPKTKKQWEQSHLRISKCEHDSESYNEIKQNKFYKQCGTKIKLCQKCKNKIKKLKKAGLVK